MPDIRLSLDEETLARVDEARGEVARTKWIRGAVERRLDRSEEVRAADTFARQVRVPEPRPSKTPPEKEQPVSLDSDDRSAAGTGGWSTKVCTHPRDKRQVFGWGTLCGVCNERITT